MTALIRASVSLDGKLLTAAGKPSRCGISDNRLHNAGELLLTIHLLIAGNDSAPTLSGFPGEFLPKDLEWELVFAATGTGGTIKARYRKRKLKERKA